MSKATIHCIKRFNGMAGQYGYTVRVQYPGEEVATLTFYGSEYGGPIVMATKMGGQVFVREVGRFGGMLNESWVRRFFE